MTSSRSIPRGAAHRTAAVRPGRPVHQDRPVAREERTIGLEQPGDEIGIDRGLGGPRGRPLVLPRACRGSRAWLGGAPPTPESPAKQGWPRRRPAAATMAPRPRRRPRAPDRPPPRSGAPARRPGGTHRRAHRTRPGPAPSSAAGHRRQARAAGWRSARPTTSKRGETGGGRWAQHRRRGWRRHRRHLGERGGRHPGGQHREGGCDRDRLRLGRRRRFERHLDHGHRWSDEHGRWRDR